MVPIWQPKVALQHPFRGDRVRPTPGAEGTALHVVGQKPTSRRSAQSHPARMTRLKTITGHRAPQSECPKECGFREGPRAGKSTLGPTFTPARTDQTGCHSGVCGPIILFPGRPFTLAHIPDFCTKFNEGYTLHRMANYRYASGNRSVRSTLARLSVLTQPATSGLPAVSGRPGLLPIIFRIR